MAIDKAAPLSPEVQALNAGLKEVANMLLHALPMSKQRRLKLQQGTVFASDSAVFICCLYKSKVQMQQF